MARSARSRSMRPAMSPRRPRPAGMTGKRWGRIGDSPIIGAGTYADDRGCAVSATGCGRIFHPRRRRARDLRADAARRARAQAAADAVMAEVKALGGDGGVIVVSPRARWSIRSTRPACTAARPIRSGRSVGLYAEAGRAIGQGAPQPLDFLGGPRRARARGNRRPPRGSPGRECSAPTGSTTGS